MMVSPSFRKLAFAALLCQTLLPALVHAGGGSVVGNGGGGVVCRAENGRIYRAELLDLKEAEEGWRGFVLPVFRSDEAEPLQLERALRKFGDVDPSTVVEMRHVLHKLYEEPGHVVRLSGPNHLPIPLDTDIRSIQDGVRLETRCEFEGVASFDDSQFKLTLDGEILDAMSPTDRAALSFHEALYYVQRHRAPEALVSISARRITSIVFSAFPLASKLEDPRQDIEHAQLECKSNDSAFFVLRHPNFIRILFTRIGGRDLIDLSDAQIYLGSTASVEEAFVTSRFEPSFGIALSSRDLSKLFQENEPHGPVTLDFFALEGATRVPSQSLKHADFSCTPTSPRAINDSNPLNLL